MEDNKEYTISEGKANLFSFLFFIPIFLITWVPYYFIWDLDFVINKNNIYNFLYGLIGCIIAFIISIVLHELIHGFVWSRFTKNGWKSIKIGIVWKSLLPFCHCYEPLKAYQYRLGLVMPTIILGIIPVIYSLITGSFDLLFYGFLMLLGGVGDIIVFFMMSKVKSDSIIKDHPSKMGFIVEN